jgi:hypothetical protein
LEQRRHLVLETARDRGCERAAVGSQGDQHRPSIGAVAGPTIELPSVALRSASGQGSVSPEGYLAELPTLVDEINAGAIAVKPNSMPLSDVEAVWTTADVPGERTVLLSRGS